MSIVVAIFLALLIGIGLGFQTDTVRRLWKQRREKEKNKEEKKSGTQNGG